MLPRAFRSYVPACSAAWARQVSSGAPLLSAAKANAQEEQHHHEHGEATHDEPAPEGVNSSTLGDRRIAGVLAKLTGPRLYCSAQDSVLEAVKKMAKCNVGSLLVYDPAVASDTGVVSSNEVVGIVTERDYLTKVVVEGRSSSETTVSAVMTPQDQLLVLTPDHSIIEAMQLMADANVRHLPVVESGKLVGLLSIRDVVRAVVDEYREEVTQLKDYLQGSY